MKTAIMTSSYLEGTDPTGSRRLTRLDKFLYWNLIKNYHGYDCMFVSDNGSPLDLVNIVSRFYPSANFLRYAETLPRLDIENGYQYCWRHLYTLKILIQLGYEKIIVCDSDTFIVSGRLTKYVADLKSGWTAFNIRRYNFPSAEFFILCKDAFPLYERFTSCPYQDHVGKLMETAIPFTHIEHGLNCDRYGETRTPQCAEMDLYSQCPTDIPLVFNA